MIFLHQRVSLLVASAWLCLLSTAAYADAACLLAPAELEAATGRAFAEGKASSNAGDGSPLCVYAEKERPKRNVTVGVSTTNAKAQFDSRMRLLAMGGKSIGLNGVGEAAYFNGTAAGVLNAGRLITLSNLRRGSDAQIPPERVVELLNTALQRAAQ